MASEVSVGPPPGTTAFELYPVSPLPESPTLSTKELMPRSSSMSPSRNFPPTFGLGAPSCKDPTKASSKLGAGGGAPVTYAKAFRKGHRATVSTQACTTPGPLLKTRVRTMGGTSRRSSTVANDSSQVSSQTRKPGSLSTGFTERGWKKREKRTVFCQPVRRFPADGSRGLPPFSWPSRRARKSRQSTDSAAAKFTGGGSLGTRTTASTTSSAPVGRWKKATS